jgi:predicted phage tail protein
LEYPALADGSYTFSVRAVDAAGNADATPATRDFTLDATAPDTSVTGGPEGPTSNTSPSFTFTGSPAADADHFECDLSPVEPGGDVGFSTCVPGVTYADLAEDSYTFSVRAVDALGNTDATPATRDFTVDTTAPDTSVTDGPDGATADTTPTFTYAGTPAADVDHFECDLSPVEPGGAVGFENCPADGLEYPALADGSYTFSVRAVDAAGNADATAASRDFTLDATAPDTTIIRGTSGPNSGTVASFIYSGSPAADVDHFECDLSPVEPGGSSGFATCPSNDTAYSALLDDDYTFSVRAVDALGNADSTPATREFTVDTVAPDTTIDAGPTDTVGSGTGTFAYSGTPAGDVALMECDLNPVEPGGSAGFETCPTSGKGYTHLQDGRYTFSVRAVDEAGNTDPTPATRDFIVADTDPRITASLSSAGPASRYGWYRAPVTVRFTCTGAELTTACPEPVTVAGNGVNQVVQRTIASTNGQSDTVTVILDVDRTAPRLRAGHIDWHRIYRHAPKVTCKGTDKLSGIASCTVRSKVHGDHVTYRIVATDKAGNRTVKKGRFHYLA